MEFRRKIWNKSSIQELEKYLYNLKNIDKIEWTRNIVRTSQPVLAIKLDVLKNIAKQISNGNYESFLDIMPDSSYEILLISAYVISRIKNFQIQKKYLEIYSLKCDNWSSCDTLKFTIKNNEDNYLNLSKEYIQSPYPFVRRIGINILFSLLKTETYLNDIYEILNSFKGENEYYVNMVNAWIICELFIKHRTQTIVFLSNHHLNKFTINKAISKCRDSYRVSKEDKEMLLQYKVK